MIPYKHLRDYSFLLIALGLILGCQSEEKEAFLNQNRAVFHFEKLGGQVLSPEQTDEGVWTLLLSNCNLQDKDLRPLVDLPHIQAIHLENTAITDEAMTYLSPLTRLLELNLGQTKVTDSGMELLTNHRHLKRLHLNQTDVSNQGCQSIADFSDLVWLIISQTRITDEGLIPIGKLKSLRALWMNDLPITDDGLTALSSLQELSELTMQRTKITNESWKYLEAFPRMETLDLNGCEYLTVLPNSMDQQFPELMNLWLSDTGIHGDALASLQSTKKLELLAFSRTKVNEQSVQALTGLENLRHIYARNLDVDRGVLEKLALKLPDCQLVY